MLKPPVLRQVDKSAVLSQMAAKRVAIAQREAMRPAVGEAGEAALKRLLPVAQGHTGQCRVIARFLLSLYNGERFPFDLTDLRLLDFNLHDDCLAVLRMDHQPQKEVHQYFQYGGKIWEGLAKDWDFLDHHGKNWRSNKEQD